CPDPVVPQPLPDKPASEMTPEELCTVEAAADVEVSKNEMSEAENEVNAQESFTSDPADITAAETAPMGATPVETAPTDRTPAVTTLPQEAPQPVISGGRRNRWLVTAGLSVFGLLVICLVLGRSGRDHQHAVPVQAREPQPAQAEPAAASAPADQNALTDAKDSTPGLDSAVSSNSVASSAPDASSSVKAGPEVVAEPAPTKPAFPALKLQGILFSPQHPSAIINGALVRRNDRLDGARIVEIRQTTVTVEFQKERRVLSLE